MIYIIKDGIQRQFFSNGDRIFDILRLYTHHLTYWKHMGFGDMLSELEPKSIFSDPMWYVANLASADLLFTFLTPFHAINFSWRWVGGDAICKLHGFLADTSYNTSITTLLVISYLRLKAITDPFNSRSDNFSNREYMKLVLTWCMCLVISSPTASIDKVETNEDGKLICVNTSWGSTGWEIYYNVQAIHFIFS